MCDNKFRSQFLVDKGLWLLRNSSCTSYWEVFSLDLLLDQVVISEVDVTVVLVAVCWVLRCCALWLEEKGLFRLAPLHLRKKGRDWSLKEANEMHVRKGCLWGLNYPRTTQSTVTERSSSSVLMACEQKGGKQQFQQWSHSSLGTCVSAVCRQGGSTGLRGARE